MSTSKWVPNFFFILQASFTSARAGRTLLHRNAVQAVTIATIEFYDEKLK
jgi:hypothetical protein